jgi:hypothetical protein
MASEALQVADMLKDEGLKISWNLAFDADQNGRPPLVNKVVPPPDVFAAEDDDVEVLEDGLVAGRLRPGSAGGNRYRRRQDCCGTPFQDSALHCHNP